MCCVGRGLSFDDMVAGTERGVQANAVKARRQEAASRTGHIRAHQALSGASCRIDAAHCRGVLSFPRARRSRCCSHCVRAACVCCNARSHSPCMRLNSCVSVLACVFMCTCVRARETESSESGTGRAIAVEGTGGGRLRVWCLAASAAGTCSSVCDSRACKRKGDVRVSAPAPARRRARGRRAC